MSTRIRTLAVPAAGVVLALSACGQSSRPVAGGGLSSPRPLGRGVVDDYRARHLPCLRKLGMPVSLVGKTDLLLGRPPSQARVTFDSTPGAAQSAQIQGQSEAAEVIGSALLYPGAMPDGNLKPIEKCLAQDVKG